MAELEAEWMGPIYDVGGRTVSSIESSQKQSEKRLAYRCDITYGTNNEFGFDYLRDNLAFDKESQMQKQLNFAIVDEVDSILIDEARTPLIISGQADQGTELYVKMNQIVPRLKPAIDETEAGDYTVDEKTKQVFLTEEGHNNVEQVLTEFRVLGEGESLYDPANIRLMPHITAALRAHAL